MSPIKLKPSLTGPVVASISPLSKIVTQHGCNLIATFDAVRLSRAAPV